MKCEVKRGAEAPHEIRRGSVALNTIWNFVGQMWPMFVAAFAIPILIHRLGVDRFGILSLIWIIVGYFSLFDFGIGRAVTKLLAESLAVSNIERSSGLVWASSLSMLFIGTLFGGALFAAAPWLSHSVLKIPDYLLNETMRSVPWLAITVPFVTVSCGFRGMLEAQQNFAAVNALRSIFGTFNYLGPLLVLPFSHSLLPIVISQAGARILNCGLYFWIVRRSMPSLWSRPKLEPTTMRALFGFGSWLTVSNILSPAMVYLDRFLIGSLASVSSVAYYAVPFDAVTKLWLVPSALEGVLFPAFSHALATNNRDRATSLFQRGVSSAFAILFPFMLAIVLFAPEGLRVWVGASFAARSSGVLRILAIGVFINSLAHLPYALIQASGRPDITAKLHLVEIPIYFGLLYGGIRVLGISGAATAWTARLTLEAAFLFFVSRDRTPARLWTTIVGGSAALLLAGTVSGLPGKLMFLVGGVSVFAAILWWWAFDDSQRTRFRGWIKLVPAWSKINA